MRNFISGISGETAKTRKPLACALALTATALALSIGCLSAAAPAAFADTGTTQPARSSAGFFQWLGDTAAADILTNAPLASYTHVGEAGDATTLDNLTVAIAGVDYCNQIRAAEGVGELKITSQLMAISEVQSNASAYTIGHTQQYNVGENLAWGLSNVSSAFKMWYDFEKPSNGGHYQNIINSSYALSGYSVNQYGSYHVTQGQVFIWQTSRYGQSYTVSEYWEKLNEYKSYLAEAGNRFATRLYTAILDRQPDQEGLTAQVNALNAGTAPADIAYNYFNSQEYFSKGETAEQTIERIYQVMFGRASDAEGKALWVAKMNAGASLRAIVAGFSQSPEYKAYFSSEGLNSDEIPVFDKSADKVWDAAGNLVWAGGNWRDVNEGATQFAQRMYTQVLGREAEVAGLNAQTMGLLTGTSCAQIAVNFFNSGEFAAHGYDRTAALEHVYTAILGREGSDDEIKAWADRMGKEGLALDDVVRGFCQSNEFEAICQQYGLTSGMR